jgi:hypothetical protein
MEDHTGLLAGGTIIVTLVIVLFSLVATIVPIVLVVRWLSKVKGQNQQILTTGIPAQARVVQMGPTGMTVNDSPQMNLVVEVHPPPMPGYREPSPPFMANLQAFVPVYAMGRVQPGSMVPVRFQAQPGMPPQVAIDFRAMGFM